MAPAWPDAGSGRGYLVASAPGEHLVRVPAVDHRAHIHPAQEGTLAAVRQPGELSWRVRVGVDREVAARLDREAKKTLRRIETLRPAVDLDSLVEALRGREDDLRIELGWGPAALAGGHATGKVAEDVEVRVGERSDQAAGHQPGLHAQFGMDARHHEVEPREKVLLLVERAVRQDVHFDPGQDPERSQLEVQRRDL